ncbi:hypothetical protein E3G52_005241 [Mycobacteroides abscessus]|uniref:hypothetical protein n=1 Tax=Mycobacteroides abscessus TaxID=36809 RepID=UPI001C6AFAC3|nr:hypothetical protein [Mycobacteroides abscessus]MBE5458333.1 hypothetical protein [Mycobacteroides abscessus]
MVKMLDGKGEGGPVDLGTLMQDPEQVFIAIAIHPKAGNQVMTVHRSLDGAKAQIESYADLWHINHDQVTGSIVQTSLLR